MIQPTPGATGGAEAGFAIAYAGVVPQPQLGWLTVGWRVFTFYLLLGLGALLFFLLSRRSSGAHLLRLTAHSAFPHQALEENLSDDRDQVTLAYPLIVADRPAMAKTCVIPPRVLPSAEEGGSVPGRREPLRNAPAPAVHRVPLAVLAEGRSAAAGTLLGKAGRRGEAEGDEGEASGECNPGHDSVSGSG